MHRYGTALVLGRGRSGRAAEALLRSEGTVVYTVCEDLTPDYRYENLHFDPDVAIVSPGFSLEHPWVKDLVEHGVPLRSELELGWSRRHCPAIAVTGSNGKSSVVKWLADALTESGYAAVPCGNYGLPVCAAVMLPDVPDWLVMEVSSFQLETVHEFYPDIGVFLNILPNHLDRHRDLKTYCDVKLRLFAQMREAGTAVIPLDLFQTLEESCAAAHVCKTFGLQEGADYRFEAGRVGEFDLRGTYFDNEVLGAAAAAVAAVWDSCGLPREALEEATRRFEPLSHRMQLVAEIDGVRYVDDSKATNMAAMCAALRMTRGRVHLIAGGRPKESDWSFAKDLLAQRVSRLYLIGEACDAMQAAWEDVTDCAACETLERAVAAARESAEPGDTVLLSPACTSFDQFSSFAERGEVFVREVTRLTDCVARRRKD
ncbi:UDP-N-acetylmuramoyl-L-alanine--D-glutamate ligase [Tichowtungia aerotolerans]|uniref:UDP-N-acetylmuramoylalanine--D-glutamate ligase n=1 Tax=Tichowtungia aerotolerans TaxID=2697043 RepID=A0A6P1M7A5_9BACT|nr:UDP-N-acetylmuramoyl-L-alanine--D-glutamate ligase [Tichowtungia aerotolerans]QHI69731.1 UDP-N-acetylmuramoyl-L-alanine--D-glutamate ligase [Tichowtungia aerotolerans]